MKKPLKIISLLCLFSMPIYAKANCLVLVQDPLQYEYTHIEIYGEGVNYGLSMPSWWKQFIDTFNRTHKSSILMFSSRSGSVKTQS